MSGAARTQPAPITGMGAVTSVGLGATAAAAGIRAGVSRPSDLPEFQVLDPQAQALVALQGHPLRGYTDGFTFLGRWLRLARGAVEDLVRSGAAAPPADRAFWSATAVVAATPVADDEIFLPEEPGGAAAMLRDGFLGPLETGLGVPLDPTRTELFPGGRTAFVEALRLALLRLGEGGVERALVLGVDSLLEPLVLQRLASEHRLKTDETPTGLMPGEAAACLLLERAPSARRRGARPLATAVAAVFDREQLGPGGDRPTAGRALARCLRQAIERLSPTAPFAGDLVLDLNGETWRAREWGHARVLLRGQVGEPREHLPCTSLGDTGAAHAAVGSCFAGHLLRRGLSRNGTALVAASSEQGEVGAIALGPAPP